MLYLISCVLDLYIYLVFSTNKNSVSFPRHFRLLIAETLHVIYRDDYTPQEASLETLFYNCTVLGTIHIIRGRRLFRLSVYDVLTGL